MSKRESFTYVTEDIRRIPVLYLLELKMSTLDCLEKKVRDEVRRTNLALKWIRGIKSIKRASKNGGQNG